MIKKGSKVKYKGLWTEPLFQADLNYYNNIWNVIDYIHKAPNDNSIVVQSMYNKERSEDVSSRGFEAFNEKYWYMNALDFEEIQEEDLLPEELFKI